MMVPVFLPEVPLAVRRHATSKISSAEDLQAIRTLGFRGEALASIASVSHFTLISRHRDDSLGTQIRVEGGHVVDQEATSHPAGTTVVVEHLFFNTPARRKFLKAPRTEAGHIHRVVTRYALAYPEVRFTYVNDGRQGLRTSGSGRLLDVLVAVFGKEVAGDMVPVGQVEPPWPEPREVPQVWGFVGKPNLHRANRQQIILFLNRRWIHDYALTQAVLQAYHTFLPVRRYPIAVLFIALDPHLVDVNVYPTKAEVRFQHPRSVFAAVQKTVRSRIVDIAPVRQVAPPSGWTQPPGWAERRQSLIDVGQSQQHPLDLPVEDTPIELPRPREAEAGDTLSAGMAIGGQKDRLLPLLRVIGQVGAAYIVAEGPDGLYLIDQHAAHERILYEKLMAERKGQGEIARQQLLEPVPVTLDTELGSLVEQHLDTLLATGFEIESFGQNTYLVRALPAVLSGQDPVRVIEEVVRGLAEEENVVEKTAEEQLVTLICKRAAVKAGQVLSDTEMRALVRELEACQTLHTCPHGRPTMVHITATELAKLFGRLG